MDVKVARSDADEIEVVHPPLSEPASANVVGGIYTGATVVGAGAAVVATVAAVGTYAAAVGLGDGARDSGKATWGASMRRLSYLRRR